MFSKIVEDAEDFSMSDAFEIDIDDAVMEKSEIKVYTCKKCGFTKKMEI
jgi:hypothetical protein